MLRNSTKHLSGQSVSECVPHPTEPLQVALHMIIGPYFHVHLPVSHYHNKGERSKLAPTIHLEYPLITVQHSCLYCFCLFVFVLCFCWRFFLLGDPADQSSPHTVPRLFEGDVRLTKQQELNRLIFGDPDGSPSRAATNVDEIKWPNAVVPYEFDCSVGKWWCHATSRHWW